MCRAYDGARNEEAPPDAALFEAWSTVSAVTGIQARHCVLCKSGRLCLSVYPCWLLKPSVFCMPRSLPKQGRTGFPMVDAVVRCLLQGGWVNFRMRAMVFSFAAYHLWIHWWVYFARVCRAVPGRGQQDGACTMPLSGG